MEAREPKGMKWKDKNILVVGMGRSGIAAARALRKRGSRVVICDLKEENQVGPVVNELRQLGVGIITGRYPTVQKEKIDLVVTSPGVPRTEPPLVAAEQLGIPIWSELELAFIFSSAPWVAITGTNGKTTTTALTGQVLRDTGRTVLVGGNIGQPLVEEVETFPPSGVIVAEVSSFQLESVHTFRPRVAAILNITPDHLDRHRTMEEYVRMKACIFANQGPEDFTVLNYDDPLVRQMSASTRGQVFFFSRQKILESPGAYVEKGWVVIQKEERVPVLPTAAIAIRGAHNLENALAAAACGLAMGVPAERLAETLRTFPGVPHRLEKVKEIGGVLYVNDSKGTNPDAAIKALEAFDCPIVLIAGGKNKGSDFTAFASKIKERVRCLVLLGQAAPQIEEAVKRTGFDNIYRVASIEEAVHKAASLAQPGEVVLLSPACASWDMFNNFEERGERFKEAVYSLLGR